MRKAVLIILLMPSVIFADDSVSPEIVKAEFEKADKEFSQDNSLLALAKQVESLKNRVVIQAATDKSTQKPRTTRVKGATAVFNYLPDAVYDVYSGVDFVTDIRLKPGEILTTAPVAGDTVRWNLSVMKSGAGQKERTHLIIKPLEEGLETNLIITTNEHTYQLQLHGSDFHMPSVSWNYPQDKEEILRLAQEKKNIEEPVTTLSSLRFDYEICGKNYPWKPLRVFDDGKKTFLQMPDEMAVSDAPVLFLRDDADELTLTNYRVKGNYYIVDRLFKSAELRVGKTESIEISFGRRKNLFQRLF